MVDFTASRLEQLAASAYDLAVTGFGSAPSGTRWKLCQEPYCGGMYWDATKDWQPEAPPPVDKTAITGLMAAAKGAAPGGLDNIEKAREAEEKIGPHAHQHTREEALEDLKKRGSTKLEYVGAKVHVPLDKPIATEVRLERAGRDEWPSWMGSHYAEVQIEKQHKDDVEFLLRHLTPFMRVDTDIKLAGKLVRQGATLLSVKPEDTHLRTHPWIGSKADLEHDKLPMVLTFGEANDPNFNYDEPPNVNVGLAGQNDRMPKQTLDKETYKPMENTEEEKALVKDFQRVGDIYAGKRAKSKMGDFISGSNNDPVGAPAPERPLKQPLVVPVKRLDIVMRRAHEMGDKEEDFTPPLLQSQDKFWRTLREGHEFFNIETPELVEKATTAIVGGATSDRTDLPLNNSNGIGEVSDGVVQE